MWEIQGKKVMETFTRAGVVEKKKTDLREIVEAESIIPGDGLTRSYTKGRKASRP